MLEEMEAALLTEDPRLFSVLSQDAKPVRSNRKVVGLILIPLGIVTLFAGLIAQLTPIGLLGFVLTLSGLIIILTGLKTSLPRPKAPGLESRLEQRWDERNNQ